VENSKRQDEKLTEEIMSFSRHIAGSSRITAACLCSNYSSLSTSRTATQVLLVIENSQPRLMNYVKAFGASTLVVLAVDKWVFERDVNRGLLGEALAGGLIFPYKPITNEEYLQRQEVILKRRLILELLQSLVLDFPELSYELYIKPRYFMYETWLISAPFSAHARFPIEPYQRRGKHPTASGRFFERLEKFGGKRNYPLFRRLH